MVGCNARLTGSSCWARPLPSDLDAAVVVVLHLLADHRSLLPQILERRTELPVSHARDGDVLEAGRVYVAPPDAHLAIDPVDRRVRLEETEPLRFHRPSIDRAFETAAGAFGRSTIAVVLTGTGSDGTAGAVRVRELGGTVFAQEAPEFAPMPRAAIDAGADLVIGNHAHWAGAVEVYKGKPIWYALGNFVFDQTWSEPTMEGMTLELTFEGSRLVQAWMHPHLILDGAQPNFLDPAGDGRVVMGQVFAASKGLLPW